MRCPKLEWPIRLKESFNHLYHDLKLFQAVLSLLQSSEFWIANEFGFKSLTVPNLVSH